ncbi:MAG: hypothetical protein K2X87_30510 [Gemmataceae bacterium]|nr:hypothetical protein [Gemmataceae bacterium]
MNNPPDRTDDAPGPDPAEAELVAYLDGELGPDAAAAVEARLAADPAYRDRADALRRPFDLLDFLPKPEPSPDFATRTLATAQVAEPAVSGTGTATASAVPRSRPWARAAGITVAAGLSLVAGYFAVGALRPAPPQPTPPTAEGLSLADLRVVENLPLYAVADDLPFVERLAAPDLFGGEAADSTPGPAPPPDKPTGKTLDALAAAFRDLPTEQRDRVRRFDRELHELPADRRDRLTQVLECYAAWLDRLPDAERAAVLAAPTADARMLAVRTTRRSQWVAALPAARREQLKKLPPAERDATLWLWKDEEDRRRERWEDAAFQWEAARLGRVGPLEAEAVRKGVAAFARAAYRPDDPARPTRLNGVEQTRLREALDLAEKGGEWGPLGRAVYQLARKYETLPEPASGKPVLDFPDLWSAAQRYFVRTKPKERLSSAVGKWPDFALGVAAEADRSKQLEVPPTFALGPSRPAEFKPEVRAFLPDLRRKATAAEWKALEGLEGKWPAYPRELVKLAKAHDLSVPGAMPPGPPSAWDKAFDPARRAAPKSGG